MEKLELSYIVSGSIKLHSHFENNVAVPQSVKQSATIMPQIFHSHIYIYIRKNIYLHKYLYTNVHTSIIHNSENVETTQMFIN